MIGEQETSILASEAYYAKMEHSYIIRFDDFFLFNHSPVASGLINIVCTLTRLSSLSFRPPQSPVPPISPFPAHLPLSINHPTEQHLASEVTKLKITMLEVQLLG